MLPVSPAPSKEPVPSKLRGPIYYACCRNGYTLKFEIIGLTTWIGIVAEKTTQIGVVRTD